MAIDPVCGMTVDEQKAPATAVHEGTTYYFCAPGCKRTFEKDPGGEKGDRLTGRSQVEKEKGVG